jgi:deoxyribodipyrimidine photolyase
MHSDRAHVLRGGATAGCDVKLQRLRRALRTGLLGAVAALREGLRARGSDLLVRVGPAAAEVPEVARLLGAACVVAEEEVEHRRAQLTLP